MSQIKNRHYRLKNGWSLDRATKRWLRRGKDLGDAMVVDSLCELALGMVAKAKKGRYTT